MSAEDDQLEVEQRYRASAYALLAALLRATPDQNLLDQLVSLSPEEDEQSGDALMAAMAQLASAARSATPETLEDEYNALFVGIGRGEVVPYGSWYMTGYMMEKPLSDLRDDLKRLGFERQENNQEPEDHLAALFEVFSAIVSDGSSLSEQERFYETHLKPWLGQFFADLAAARSADFYKPVAQFGAAFIELEQAYLSMNS